MHAALRPYLTTGVGLVGAGALVVAPIAPVTAPPTIAAVAPAAAVVNQPYALAAFPQDIIDLVQGLTDALGAGAVTDIINNFIDNFPPPDLTELVAVVQGGLLNLAPVVFVLLQGLEDIVDTLLTRLAPVVETVFDGLVNVVNALTNNEGLQGVLVGLGVGLGIVVNAIFGGLNGSPIADAIATAIGSLFGGLGGAAAASTVDVEGGADLSSEDAALTAMTRTVNDAATRGALPATASDVAGAATDEDAGDPEDGATHAGAVLETVDENTPSQADEGLGNAIANQVAEGSEDGGTEGTEDGVNEVTPPAQEAAPETEAVDTAQAPATDPQAGGNPGTTGRKKAAAGSNGTAASNSSGNSASHSNPARGQRGR